VLGFHVPFISLNKLCKSAGPKPFCLAKQASFDFSSFNFNSQGHILSTARVALMYAASSSGGKTVCS
jgi:hypothetical protein